MQKFKADRHTTKVYNMLLEDFTQGGNGLTRSEMEARLRREFNQAQWSAIMKKVRNRVMESMGLMIPDTGRELGFRYFITDDPNAVIPGMLVKLRSQATNTSKIMREREYIRLRDDSLDKRMNGRVLQHADIIIKMNELVEQSMSLVDENLRDAMDERVEIRKEVTGDAPAA